MECQRRIVNRFVEYLLSALLRCFVVAAAAGMIRRDAVRTRKDNEGSLHLRAAIG